MYSACTNIIDHSHAHTQYSGSAAMNSVYRHCFLKLTVFKLIQYDRVLITDADSVVLKNLDHLFHLPRTPVAIPHAHWLENRKNPVFSTSILMVCENVR